MSTFGEAFSSIGLQLGARYDGSPIIVPDSAPLADDFARYTPSSVPGGRAPISGWTSGAARGSSLYDRLGVGFTLLRFGGHAAGSAALEAAARRRGIPLTSSITQATRRAISTSAIWCLFVPTSMWPGGATGRPMNPICFGASWSVPRSVRESACRAQGMGASPAVLR